MQRFFKSLSKQQKEVGLYALALTVLGMVAGMVLWRSGGVFSKAWELICAVVEPLAYGFMLSYVLNPIVTRISHLIRRGGFMVGQGERRRLFAVIITACLVFLMLFGLLASFVVMLANGFSSININWASLDDLITAARTDIMGFLATVRAQLAEWGLITEDAESGLVSAFTNVKNVASTTLFSVIFTIYFLLDGDRLLGYFHRLFYNLLGDQAGTASILLDDADRVFSGYFKGQALDAFIVGVLSGILLTIVGVPYAPVVGLLAGLGNLIPYIGGPVGFGSIILVCLSEEAWSAMALGVIVMAIVMFVDGNILNPRLLSSSVEVHPMLVVAALIAGGAVGGITGMLVAVPTAAWLKIQIDRWMEANEARRMSQLEQGPQSGEPDQGDGQE